MRNVIATTSSLTLAFCLISHAAYGMQTPEEEKAEKAQIIRGANLGLCEAAQNAVAQQPDGQVKCVMQYMPLLTEEECTNVENLMLFPHGVDPAFLLRCSRLTKLNITGGSIPCNTLSSLTTLTELSVGGEWDFAQALPQLTNLTCLTVAGCESLKLPADLSSITKLSVSSSLLSQETLRCLPRLNSLGMTRCTFEEQLSLPNLKELSLDAGSSFFFHVEEFTGLRTLMVSDPEDCERFSCLTNITELSFDGTNRISLNRKISAMFPNLVQIERIHFVEYNGVGSSDDLIVGDLSELQYLQRFRVNPLITLADLEENASSLMEENPAPLKTALNSLVGAKGGALEVALGEICYRNVKRLESNRREFFERVSLLWPFCNWRFEQ